MRIPEGKSLKKQIIINESALLIAQFGVYALVFAPFGKNGKKWKDYASYLKELNNFRAEKSWKAHLSEEQVLEIWFKNHLSKEQLEELRQRQLLEKQLKNAESMHKAAQAQMDALRKKLKPKRKIH